jgi:hypothetical protein
MWHRRGGLGMRSVEQEGGDAAEAPQCAPRRFSDAVCR